MHDHRLISLQNRAAFTMMKQGHTPRMWVPLSLGRERGRETVCRHCGLTGRVWSQRVDQVEGEVFAEACDRNTGVRVMDCSDEVFLSKYLVYPDLGRVTLVRSYDGGVEHWAAVS